MLELVKTNTDAFHLTKLCIITDGICYDDIYKAFYQEITKKIKSIGFSCNIILTKTYQKILNNEFGYIADQQQLVNFAKSLNGDCFTIE